MKHRQHAIIFTALVFLSTLALFSQIQPIGVGNAPNDGLGDTLRGAMIKVNTNFNWITNIFSYDYAAQRISIGTNAGTFATEGTNIFIGDNAGEISEFPSGTIAIGQYAAHTAQVARESVVVGNFAAQYSSNLSSCIYLGNYAGQYAKNTGNQFIGKEAGRYATNTRNSILIGTFAGENLQGITSSFFFGEQAGIYAANASGSIFISGTAGQNATNAFSSIFIGADAGRNGYESLRSIFLGHNAGRDVSRANTLIIDARSSTAGTNGLIYGEFDNRVLKVNGSLYSSNLTYLAPRWIDEKVSGVALRFGGSSPVRTEVEGGTGIFGIGFNAGEDVDFQMQWGHGLASTNANFPTFYYSPHLHVTPTTTASGTNCAFQISYQIAPLYTTFSNTVVTMTNWVTFTNASFPLVLSFGNVTNNALQGKDSVLVRGNIACLTNNTGGRVILESADFHIPLDTFGSTAQIGD